MKTHHLTPEIKRKIVSWVLGIAFGMVLYVALLFLPAGKWDWFWGWVFMALMILAMAAHVLVLVRSIRPCWQTAPGVCASREPNPGISG